MSPTPSPVPSADQLCRDAGWLQAANPRGTLRTSLAGTRRRTMFDEAEGRTVRGSSPSDDARGIAIRNRIQASLRQSLVAAQGQAGVADVASAPLPSPPTLPPPMASGAESLSPMHRSSSTDAAGITIPRSLAEIYQISNRNRTRNKEKKRAQDGSGSSSGGGGASKKKARGAGAAAGAGGGAASGSGAGGKKATEDPSTFMQRIGWVEDGADSVAGAGRGGNKRGDGGGAAGAGGGGSRGQGFRYGGAVAAAAGMASGSGGNAAETTSTGGRGSKGGRRGGSGRSGKYSNRGQAAKNNPCVALHVDVCPCRDHSRATHRAPRLRVVSPTGTSQGTGTQVTGLATRSEAVARVARCTGNGCAMQVSGPLPARGATTTSCSTSMYAVGLPVLHLKCVGRLRASITIGAVLWCGSVGFLRVDVQ